MDQLTYVMVTTAPFGVGAIAFVIAGLIAGKKQKSN